MRSSRGDVSQLSLWDDEVEPALSAPRPGPRRHQLDRKTIVVVGSEFASHGWPEGTVLHHQPVVRVARGDLAVVWDGDDLLVGFWGLDVGRPALFTDGGSIWLGERSTVVGVVTTVEAPLSF